MWEKIKDLRMLLGINVDSHKTGTGKSPHNWHALHDKKLEAKRTKTYLLSRITSYTTTASFYHCKEDSHNSGQPGGKR